MKHKPSLPIELLQTIFNEVHITNKIDLLNIRLTSLSFCSLVTPYVFRTVHVRDASTSTQRLYSILTSPHLVKEIKDVFVIQGESEVLREDNSEHEEQGALVVALMELRRATSLTSLNIIFLRPGGFNDPPTSQTSIIHSLTAGIPSSSLTSLSLTADHLFSDTFKTQAFASKISALTCLSIITPRSPRIMSLRGFWRNVVSPHFLQPVMGTLTSLTLHPDFLVGVNPGISFPFLVFPHLSHLSLRMFIFEPENNLEDFIIRHGATLTHLRLEKCPILTKFLDNAHPNHSFHRQSDIWQRFAEKLEVLMEVIVTEQWDDRDLENPHMRGVYSRYMTCDRYRHYDKDGDAEVPERLREDDSALDLLRSVVNARRGGSRR